MRTGLILILFLLVGAFGNAEGAGMWRVAFLVGDSAESPGGAIVDNVGRHHKVLRLCSGNFSSKITGLAGVLVVECEGIREEWLAPIEKFVARGGNLVLPGKAGWFVDRNGNGKYERKEDNFPCKKINSLAGAEYFMRDFRAEDIRVLEENPFFHFFDIGRRIPWTRPKSVSWPLVKLAPGNSRILAAVALTRQTRTGPDGLGESSFYGAVDSGEAPYLTVSTYGEGMVVRIAENPFARIDERGMHGVLAANLVSKDAWKRARNNFAQYGTSQPLYANRNMIENGDIEKIFLIREKSPRGDNRITKRPFMLASGWGYNAHGGEYRGYAVKREKNGHCLFLENVPDNSTSRIGRVYFVRHIPMSCFENGRRYELGLAVRSQDTMMARADINFNLANGKRISKRFALPVGTHPWRKKSFQFDFTPYVPPGEEPARGLSVFIMMDGPGKMWIDEVYLKAITKRFAHGKEIQ